MIHVHSCPVGDIGVETDFYGELVITAQKLYSGEFSVLNYPYKGPAYSFFLAPLYSVVRLFGANWYDAGIILNLLCGAIGLTLSYRLMQRFQPRIVAITGVVFLSLVYEFFFHTHKGSSDLLFFVLYLGSLSLLLTTEISWRRLALSSLFAGIAFLTRYNGIILPVSAIIVLLSIWPVQSTIKKRLTRALLYLSVFVVVVAPWYAVNFSQTGRLASTKNLENIFVEEFYSPQQNVVSTSPAPTNLLGVLRQDPVDFSVHYLKNIANHLAKDVMTTLGWPLGALSILGLILMIVKIRNRQLTTFLVLSALYFLAMCLVYHQPRFMFPLLPSYTFGAAYLLWNWKWPRFWQIIPLLVFIVVAAGQIHTIIKGEQYYARRSPQWVIQTATALQEAWPKTVHDQTRLLARKPHLPYYARMNWVPYPATFSSAGDFLKRAHELNVDLIAVSDFEMLYHRNKPWLMKLDTVHGVTLIHDDEHSRIYRLSADFSPDKMGADPMVAEMQKKLESALQNSNEFLSITYLSEIARLLAENQDFAQSRTYLQQGISILEGKKLEPRAIIKLAELRLNYAYVCIQMGEVGKGVAMVESNLKDFAATGQPQLRQQALDLIKLYRPKP